MYKHFEDIHNLIKEQSCVAELLLHEGMKLTKRVTGQDNAIDGVVMETLTALVVSKLDIDQIKVEYQQKERQREVSSRIDAAIAAQRK